jgi:hypothetical protein
MRLRRHRTDVKDLKLMQANYVQEIARRYQRLILMAENQFNFLEEFNNGEAMWSHEKRVLKDAEK